MPSQVEDDELRESRRSNADAKTRDTVKDIDRGHCVAVTSG